jgi:hypothetical protein
LLKSKQLLLQLNFFQWFIAIVSNAYFFSEGNFEEMTSYCVISNDSKMNVPASILVCTLILVEILALGCFFALLKWNKRRKLRLVTCSLTQKYQVDENVRAIELMLPMIITHAVIFIPPLIFFALLFEYVIESNPVSAPIFEEAFNWCPIYCVLLPVVLFWRNPALRTNLRKIFHRKSVDNVEQRMVNATTAVAEQNLHFEALKRSWESPENFPSTPVVTS